MLLTSVGIPCLWTVQSFQYVMWDLTFKTQFLADMVGTFRGGFQTKQPCVGKAADEMHLFGDDVQFRILSPPGIDFLLSALAGAKVRSSKLKRQTPSTLLH